MLIVYNFKYSWSITLPDKWKYSGRPKQPTILTRFDIIIHIKVIAKPPFIQINIQKGTDGSYINHKTVFMNFITKKSYTQITAYSCSAESGP